MPIPVVFKKVGASLRATNVILQALDSPEFTAVQNKTLNDAKAAARLVIQGLDAFGAGDPQPAVSGRIPPTYGVMKGSATSIQKDLQSLDEVQAADLPGRFDEFKALRVRIKALSNSVAAAALR
jgi:hypothetical protein